MSRNQYNQLLIVDGYNVIRVDPQLQATEVRGLEFAREELLRRLEFAEQFKNYMITVVFDGRLSGNQRRNTERRGRRIDVIFSRHGERADEIIIEMITNAANPEDLLVMSNDRAIGLVAKVAGSHVLARPDAPPPTAPAAPTIGPAAPAPGVEYDDMFRKRVDYEPVPEINKKGAAWHPRKKEKLPQRDTWKL